MASTGRRPLSTRAYRVVPDQRRDEEVKVRNVMRPCFDFRDVN